MTSLWMTYAWSDNEDQDVDYVVQELEAAGLEVNLDRYRLGAGRRLWEQISEHIEEPSRCDAWAIYATRNSLNSEPCREELAIALDRALSGRGDNFPLIGIFPEVVPSQEVPSSIRVRLYVSLTDEGWKERVVSACEGRALDIQPPQIQPYHCQVHASTNGPIFEVRPRIGNWMPCVAAVPHDERDKFRLAMIEPAGYPIGTGMVASNEVNDGERFGTTVLQPATPQMSLMIYLNEMPSRIWAGPADIPFEFQT